MSPAKPSWWTAATPSADRSWCRQPYVFHREGPSSTAVVTGDQERRKTVRGHLPDEPMASAAPADESELLNLPARSEQETVRPAFPTQDNDSLRRIDPDVACHSFASSLSAGC